jgi:CHAT domain-containing protein
MGDDDAAEQALAHGIDELERQHARLGDEALKISYFDESWNLFPEMVTLQATVRRNAAAALEYAERSRARSLVLGSRPIRHTELRQRMPPTVAMIYYVTLPDRLFTWVVTSNDSSLFDYKIDRSSLARDVERYVASLDADRPVDTEVSTQLYDVLIARASEHFAGRRTLVIVPDADLQRLPFATLRNPATRHLLIEDHAVVTSPSATVFAAGIERLRERAGGRFDSALLVGDPDAGALTGLKALPAAEREAVAASRFYPRHEVLTGATATRARFVDDAPHFDLIHFAGHALVNPEYPLLSRMSFAADRDGGAQSLFAYEISRLHLSDTRLVVLAACSTAVGSLSRGEGVVSLARPFLGAGVPTVIASEWDVDDQATARLFSEFHRALSDVGDPVQALRTAQLSLLRSGDATLASPRAWGAFVALGATAQ